MQTVEGLREYCFEKALLYSEPQFRKRGSGLEQAHGIANVLIHYYFSFVTIEEGIRGEVDEFALQTVTDILEKQAKEAGFDSVETFKAACDDLRERLKGELPQEAWEEYFGEVEARGHNG